MGWVDLENSHNQLWTVQTPPDLSVLQKRRHQKGPTGAPYIINSIDPFLIFAHI